MSPVKLYHHPRSGPSRGALLAARAIGVPIDVHVIDLVKQEQLSESFLKLNPQHCVPTLDDDGFILWESRAIAAYLASKYGKLNDQLYPIDLQKRARVDQKLYFDASNLYVKIRAVFAPILFAGETEIKEPLRKELNTVLGFLNVFLSTSKWVAGDHVTIADTAIVASISTIIAAGWDLSPFPNIQLWYEECASFPGFAENEEGAKVFGEAVRRNLKNKLLY